METILENMKLIQYKTEITQTLMKIYEDKKDKMTIEECSGFLQAIRELNKIW